MVAEMKSIENSGKSEYEQKWKKSSTKKEAALIAQQEAANDLKLLI